MEFEEDRVRLQGTLDQFKHQKQTPGTLETTPDGFRVFHARENETVKSIAARHKVSPQQLVQQNEMRYGRSIAANAKS